LWPTVIGIPVNDSSPRQRSRCVKVTPRPAAPPLSIQTLLFPGESLMGLIQEFRDFALKGNLVDMALGIVIGGATVAIVKSFMDNIVSPIIGLIPGVPDMSGLRLRIGESKTVVDGVEQLEPIYLQWGTFVQNFLDFLILAFAVFVGIKVMNAFLAKAEEEAQEKAGPSDEVKLLTEIRDSLKKSG
jgi:large conductance mechanosensitive channel